MREHAMEYANAAAGAAWAAARIACGGAGYDATMTMTTMTTIPHAHAPSIPPIFPTDARRRGSYYAPAPTPQGPATMEPWGHDGGAPRQKRTIWHPNAPPAFGNIGGNMTRKATTSAAATRPPPTPPPACISQQEKMRSKKRESGGNDSTSSLGSESREHLSMGQRDKTGGADGDAGRGKYAGKKSNQRRRFNDEGDGTCATVEPDKRKDDNDRTDCVDVRHHKDDGNNQRQKRVLNHGHSSKSSFSSLGSSNNPYQSVVERNKKKKNRSQQPDTSQWQPGNNDSNFLSPSDAPLSSVFLGGLIGKNGVRALHELCSKYRWDMPMFTPVEPPAKSAIGNDGVSSSSSSVGNNDISFVLKVHINGVELGRGRGGTKASAKQDASRKALSALVPGVVFDPNGILLDTGGSKPLLRGSSHVDVGGGGAPGGNGSLTRTNYTGSEPLSLDELGPHLASQLAIGGDGAVHGRFSPDHSETSSISTAISEEVFSGGTLISGGPIPLSYKLGSQQPSSCGTLSSLNPADGTGRFLSTNIYPSASTTSGISGASSASEVDEENAYYSSRGASICSTLLHAMWQIDDRIWEPPSYSFDLCSGPCNPNDNIECGRSPTASGTAAKRKKSEFSNEFAGHRMFRCTVAINLYFQKRLVGDSSSSIMEFWESPLDYLQSNRCSSPSYFAKGDSLQSRKRKDDDGSAPQSTPSTVKDVDDAQDGRKTPKKREKGDFFQHKLESTGTGLTKRESKHKASAKLLATLFPECLSMVEVKAEAEAARELYAAKREAIQTKRPKIMFLSADKKVPGKQSAIPIVIPTKNDISLHALSLSEPKDRTKQTKWCDSTSAESSFDVEVDAALQSFHDSDEEGHWKARGVSFEDVGRIVLRRACCDDSDHIYLLLNKSDTVSTALPPLNQQALSPNDAALTFESSDSGQDRDDDNAGNSTDSNDGKKCLGDHSVILILARAVALHHPPLGCAILTVKDPACDLRSLTLDGLGHEEHLPRERFIESLVAFAKNINCTLETHDCHHRLTVTLDDIRSFLARSEPPLYHTDDVIDCIEGRPSRRHLQSVKEEESEEADDGSDGGKDRDDKLADEGTELVKRKPWKPSTKRSRRA